MGRRSSIFYPFREGNALHAYRRYPLMSVLPILPFRSCKPGVDDEDIWPASLQMPGGAPQRSATSPLAVEMLLAPLFDKLPACAKALGYTTTLSNGEGSQRCGFDTEAFRSALKEHPAGQLRPKEPRIF